MGYVDRTTFQPITYDEVLTSNPWIASVCKKYGLRWRGTFASRADAKGFEGPRGIVKKHRKNFFVFVKERA